MRIRWMAVLAFVMTMHAMPADVTVFVGVEGTTMMYPAEKFASEILREAGVSVLWRRGERPPTKDGMVIQVNLLERTPETLLPNALAVAYPYSVPSKPIAIFVDRIRNRSKGVLKMETAVLAHVLAHEITHVLQRVDRHSETGLMKERWDSADYDLMMKRPLAFTDVDLYLIQRTLTQVQVQARR